MAASTGEEHEGLPEGIVGLGGHDIRGTDSYPSRAVHDVLAADADSAQISVWGAGGGRERERVPEIAK